MTIEIDGEVSRSLPTSGGTTTVEVTLTPQSKTQPTTRHVTLLIDTSMSMFGTKLENAKSGAKQALKELTDDDYVSVVGFDSELQMVLPMTQWGTADQKDVTKDIDSIEATGGTDIYKGLEKAREQLVKEAPMEAGAVKRIILLSDGQDRYDASTYRNLAAEFDDEGLSIIAAGIGGGYDEEVMLALANASGGTPVDLSEDAIDQFIKQTVRETDSVIAPNPKLEIAPTQGFIINDAPALFDAPKTERRDINRDPSPPTLSLPELQVSHPHRLTFEVLGQPRTAGYTEELATLRVLDSLGNVLGETDVEIDYAEEAGLQRADIEKTRATAKVTSDIQDSEVSKAAVTTEIDKIKDKGWKDTAEQLEERLTESEQDGGLIRVGKSKLGEDE
ncbi:vWA domain-containing protein [Halorubellus salinus]|uniref:vWA domain-containing protein n=1 Tax=Halorubellus salinus TaxID=755309 RepID=UPI001D066013|nr:VWA domain-containing protein [Halorubellus salinus]